MQYESIKLDHTTEIYSHTRFLGALSIHKKLICEVIDMTVVIISLTCKSKYRHITEIYAMV